MSNLKMVLRVEKTLKTNTQKMLPKSPWKFPWKVSVAKFCYNHSSDHFFTVHSKFTYNSEAYDLMKLYLETSHSESGQTTAVKPFYRKLINLL